MKILNKKNSKGFTLIELLVVMAIIAVLALVVVAAINAARMQARNNERRAIAKNLQVALEGFYSVSSARLYPISTTIITPYATLTSGACPAASTLCVNLKSFWSGIWPSKDPIGQDTRIQYCSMNDGKRYYLAIAPETSLVVATTAPAVASCPADPNSTTSDFTEVFSGG